MKEMLKFEKELDKLRKRGATGISMFVKRNNDIGFSDYAKEATLYLKNMKRKIK